MNKLTQEQIINRLKQYGIKLLSSYVNAKTKMKMKCHCGNIFASSLDSFFYNKSSQHGCGCDIGKRKTEDKSGKRFGNLTVIKASHKDKDGATIWECKCACGKTTFLRCGKLARIKKTNGWCGCKKGNHDQNKNNNSSWSGYEDISGTFWGSISSGARTRNIPFNINIKQAWDLFISQNKKCAISGQDLCMYPVKNKTASLDRINSNDSYNINNIQWIHKHINIMKYNFTEKYFFSLCSLIANPLPICEKFFNHYHLSISYTGLTYNKWYRINQVAKRRNIPIKITIKEAELLYIKQNGLCAITHLPILFDKGDITASLDRIDSSKEYTIENVQWVHKDINKMKLDFPQEYLINTCKMITSYQNSVK